MYFGAVGQRFRVTAGVGARPAVCPAGTTTEDRGRFPSGATYANCYRPAEFAQPASSVTNVTYGAPTTTVSPAIQTQVSPQVSPVLTQAQASPGASFQAQPTQSAPGGMDARGGGSGMTAAELQQILADQRRAEEERREREMQALQAQMAERQALMDQVRASEIAAMEQREADRVAREAEAVQSAIDSAANLPQTSGAYVPASPLQPPIFEPGALALPGGDSLEISAGTAAPPVEAQAVPYWLLAAAAVGAAFLFSRKKGAKRK